MTNYPFLQFFSVIAVPTAFWISAVELGVWNQFDTLFVLTFGQVGPVHISPWRGPDVSPHQVLTVFMTIPPLIELAHLAPGFWRWLINIAWVRYITRRPAHVVPSPEGVGSPDNELINEKKIIIDDQSSFVDESPLLGKSQRRYHSDEITNHGQFQPSPTFPYRNIMPDRLSNPAGTLPDNRS